MKNPLEDYKSIPETLNGFYRGVVEDNNDPEKMGRVRVRVIGIHTSLKIQNDTDGIPTDHLIWAVPVYPVNGGSMSGKGMFAVPLTGSHVFVFFENGNIRQPRYIGVAPGRPIFSPAGPKRTAPVTYPTDTMPIPQEILDNAEILVLIDRFESSELYGTKGNVEVQTRPTDGGTSKIIATFQSFELPWVNNRNGISCIPKGEYMCSWTYSYHFSTYKYLVNNVSGRNGIRIHPGWWAGSRPQGYVSDSEGCILIGRDYFTGIPSTGIYEQTGLEGSSSAIPNFESLLNGIPFVLKITGVVG